MTWWIVLVAAVVVYYTVRRWIVLTIFAHLVVERLANPSHAELVKALRAKQQRLGEDSKQYEELGDDIATLDPMCQAGRRWLARAANRLRTGLSGLFRLSGPGRRDPAVRRRQAYAERRYQTCEAHGARAGVKLWLS